VAKLDDLRIREVRSEHGYAGRRDIRRIAAKGVPGGYVCSATKYAPSGGVYGATHISN